MMDKASGSERAELTLELENSEEIARYLVPSPGDLPEVNGIAVYGRTLPLNGIVGGDYLSFVVVKRH